MRVATLRIHGREAAFVASGERFVAVAEIAAATGRCWAADIFGLLESGAWYELLDWFRDGGEAKLKGGMGTGVARKDAVFAPLYRHPRKIWGIGLNYREHAGDLDEKPPTAEPASFMKPDTSIVGDGDEILLPKLSQRTTGEAELGLVFGKRCRDVAREDWQSVLAGYTTIVDMTAEDILRRNPRNLTQCKSFDTFFSFGPYLYSTDEIADVAGTRVTTVHNGAEHASNTVANMTFPPDFLVGYHSQIMTMLPGDVISTGTPGAAVLADGDTIECRIEGLEPLRNTVRDLKE